MDTLSPTGSVCVVPGMDILLTDWSMNGMHAAATTTIAAAIIIFCIPFFLGFFVDGPSFPVAITADFFSCFGGSVSSFPLLPSGSGFSVPSAADVVSSLSSLGFSSAATFRMLGSVGLTRLGSSWSYSFLESGFGK